MLTDLSHEHVDDCAQFFLSGYQFVTQLLVLLTTHVHHLQDTPTNFRTRPLIVGHAHKA